MRNLIPAKMIFFIETGPRGRLKPDYNVSTTKAE